MSQSLVITLCTQAVTLIIMLSLPIILTAMIIGFTVSIFQAVTQIQEQTLSFVPKSISVYTMIIILGPWMLNTVMQFIKHLMTNLPSFLSR